MAASLKMVGDGLVASTMMVGIGTMMVGIGCWNLSQFLGEFELVPNHCSCGFESVPNHCSCGFESVLNQCSCGIELVLNQWWLWVESFWWY